MLRTALLLAVLASGPAGAEETSPTSLPSPEVRASVVGAMANMLTLHRPGQQGLATVANGNKFVQCRRMADRALRCESAGALMQPSLDRVLVPTRVEKLGTSGWRLDRRFGNYARLFPANASAEQLAEATIEALRDGYAADLDRLGVRTAWVRDEPCPPRNGPKQNLAGVIDDAPTMRASAVHACSYDPRASSAQRDAASRPSRPAPRAIALSTKGLIAAYGPRLTGEIARLRVNSHGPRVFAVFGTSLGYIQCEPQDGKLYCEAASADADPALNRVLTPERVALLHEAGFADPGRSENYTRDYDFADRDDAAVATEILTLLHDVYGYDGRGKLTLKTE